MKLVTDATKLFHPRPGYSNYLALMATLIPAGTAPQIPNAALVQQKQGSAIMIWAIGAFVNSL